MTGSEMRWPDADELNDLPAQALAHPTRALARAQELMDEAAPALVKAVAHQTAAVVLRDFGDIDAALTHFESAIRWAERADDPERATDSRAAYGVALVMSGRARAGLSQIHQAAEGAVGVAAGRIQIRLAHSLMVLGRYSEMAQAAQSAVDLLDGSGDDVWRGRAFNHRALSNLLLGNLSEVDDDYARAEHLFARSGQRLEHASTLHDRAATAFARGDLPTSLALLDDAQQAVDALEVFEPDLEVTRTEVLLAAHLHRDALEVAEAAVARSIDLGGSATRRAELLFGAARAASALERPGLAAERSAEAWQMFRRQHRTLWAARAELSMVHGYFRDGQSSHALLRRTTLLAQRLAGVDAARAGEANLLAGRIALALGRRRSAENYLTKAAAGRSRDIRARTTAWLARAILARERNRPADLIKACSRGLDMLQDYLDTLGPTEMRTHATAQGGELASLALSLAVQSNDPNLALQWSERWRATALAIPPVHIDADAPMAKALTTLRTLSRHTELAGSVRGADASVELRRAEAEVRRVSLRRVAENKASSGQDDSHDAPRQRVQVSELASQLGDTELIELMEIDEQLYAVVLQPNSEPTIHTVGSTSAAVRTLDHALFTLRREADQRRRSGRDLSALAQRLQDCLLGPAAHQLSGDSIVVVPTGRLHAVPWGMMPALRERDVTVAPSAATWMRCHRAAQRRNTLSQKQQRVVLVAGPGLSGGADEVRQLAALYPEATLLTAADATSERVMNAMDGADLVHIAAHGTFRADSPLLSSFALYDGPLTVYDLEQLRRPPGRVVLSSCSSAVSAPSGADELLGAVSALFALGSSGVVASVVPVDDPGTVQFMLALHDALPTHSLGGALRAARVNVSETANDSRAAESFVALGA